MIPVNYARGIYLPEADLWLDAGLRQSCSFVSHAHSDHFAPHALTIASRAAAHLLKNRFRMKGEILALDWGEPWERGGYRFVLTPAGHVLGSAMIHATRIADGATLLYTGDFKLRSGFASEAAQPMPAQLLIMECTFGRPHYLMPPTEEVSGAMRAWCSWALDRGETPVLMGYSLGKAQEIQMIVGPAFPLAVHSSIAAVNRTYEELGWPLPPWEEWDGGVPPGVLVVPPTAARGGLDALPRKVCAMVTGWGLDAGARFQYRVDEVFPLTDHADYPDLLQLVEMVGPARVLTTHGFAAEFSRDLRQRGYSAWSLSGVDQMDLALEIPAPPLARRVLPDAAADGAGEFAALARLAVQVGQVPERVDKVALLAGWLAGISPEESLATAVRFLSGKTAASAPERRLIRTEWPVLQSALSLASGFSPRKIKELTRGQSDHGKNTSLVLADQRCDAAQWSLTEVCALFQAVGQAASTGVRAQLLAGAFRRMRTPESGLLAGILSGDLHVGLKHGIVEAAISLAFRQPEVLVREALRLTGDAGLTAILARAGTLDSAGPLPFYPVHREALPGLSGLPVEWHHAEGRTALYATDFRCLNTAFPVFVGNGGIASEVIVRGGIIAPGSVLKLRDLPADKAWRSEPDLFCGEAAGPRFRMVDLLWLDGKSLLNEPLAFRRKLLAGLTWHPPFEVAAGCA